MSWPVAAVIAQAVAEILQERYVVVKDGVGHVHVVAGGTAVLGVDEIGDETGEHHLAEPFVAEADVVVRALGAGGGR